MKGAEIITEYLIRERVPYAVGLCGHGNLGLLDALCDRSEQIRTVSVHHESAAGSSPTPTTGSSRAARDVHLRRARLGEPPGRPGVGPHGLIGLPGHHR